MTNNIWFVRYCLCLFTEYSLHKLCASMTVNLFFISQNCNHFVLVFTYNMRHNWNPSSCKINFIHTLVNIYLLHLKNCVWLSLENTWSKFLAVYFHDCPHLAFTWVLARGKYIHSRKWVLGLCLGFVILDLPVWIKKIWQDVRCLELKNFLFSLL